MLRKKGFTLVEIMIVVAIIGLLAAIAIPNFVRARATAQKNACIANLKQIQGAKQVWALDYNKTDADEPALTGVAGDKVSLTPDYIKKTPVCPSGGTYTVANVGSDPTCGYANGHTL